MNNNLIAVTFFASSGKQLIACYNEDQTSWSWKALDKEGSKQSAVIFAKYEDAKNWCKQFKPSLEISIIDLDTEEDLSEYYESPIIKFQMKLESADQVFLSQLQGKRLTVFSSSLFRMVDGSLGVNGFYLEDNFGNIYSIYDFPRDLHMRNYKSVLINWAKSNKVFVNDLLNLRIID